MRLIQNEPSAASVTCMHEGTTDGSCYADAMDPVNNMASVVTDFSSRRGNLVATNDQAGLGSTKKYVDFPDHCSTTDASALGAHASEPSLQGYLSTDTAGAPDPGAMSGTAPQEGASCVGNGSETELPQNDDKIEDVTTFALSVMMGLGKPVEEVCCRMNYACSLSSPCRNVSAYMMSLVSHPSRQWSCYGSGRLSLPLCPRFWESRGPFPFKLS